MTPRKSRLKIPPIISFPSTIGYFDGVSQMGIYGACMYLRINQEYNFKLWMRCGKGTNTRFDLLSIWDTLQFALLNEIVFIQIFGDS